MKKLLLMFVVAVAVIFAAQNASAAYCRTDACDDDTDGVDGARTQCCPDPAGPPADPTLICGQVDDLIGGCCDLASADPMTACSGCITDTQLPPAPCGTAAVDACIACGCATNSGCVGD